MAIEAMYPGKRLTHVFRDNPSIIMLSRPPPPRAALGSSSRTGLPGGLPDIALPACHEEVSSAWPAARGPLSGTPSLPAAPALLACRYDPGSTSQIPGAIAPNQPRRLLRSAGHQFCGNHVSAPLGHLLILMQPQVL
jgi:hypothetical protein